ncbi:MAG: endonuclease III [Bacteroidales bacterium]|nr:endonuclease III [Bacteroidales bacterium]
MDRSEIYRRTIEYFQKEMPVAETELVFRNPYELMVAVILSAQCTDKRVNEITPALFMRFPSAESLADAVPEEIFPYIRSCSYPNNKSKHLYGMASALVNNFGGVVPSDVDELQKLPGIGRKSANVIASVVFNKPAMAVDTHVFRVSARIGLTKGARTPLEAERQLVSQIPENLIPLAHHWLILHGRYICKARNPGCDKCGLSDFCHYFNAQKKE